MLRRSTILVCLLAAPLVLLPLSVSTADDKDLGIATFAGGCFWCMEPPFEKLDGVSSVTSGYTGGEEDNPTYKQVSSGKTGHCEAVQIEYDPGKITYEELLYVFWRNIDPTVENRQFCDGGAQYRSGIFYHDWSQRDLANASRDAIVESGRFPRVVTEITQFAAFWPAEEYHQDFYKKNPDHYYGYRKGCGRDNRLRQLWGDEVSDK